MSLFNFIIIIEIGRYLLFTPDWLITKSEVSANNLKKVKRDVLRCAVPDKSLILQRK